MVKLTTQSRLFLLDFSLSIVCWQRRRSVVGICHIEYATVGGESLFLAFEVDG